MKIKFFLALLTIILANICYASNYPKSRIEKEIDDMGSLLNGEGLTFKPEKTKSNATKAKIGNVNKYLYKATIDVLDFAPLTSADSNTGLLITEWYNPKGQPNIQFKINVHIKDDVISPEALEVKALERAKVNGKWSSDYKESAIGGILEDKIIRKARTLYQSEK